MIRSLLVFVVGLLFAAPLARAQYLWTNFAGLAGVTGSADGTGNAARFAAPRGVAVDASGNLYVADTQNSIIRKITPAGVVTTLAGLAGSIGSADGTGSAARFSNPDGVAVDGSGNIFATDHYNHTIRKITPAGVVSTLAGLAGSSGSANGTGSTARFYYPYGVAVDGNGNLFVSELGTHTIRKITPAGAVTTLAGLAGSSGNADGTSSAARFSSPEGVAVDGNGNVFVSDEGNHTIRKITPAGVVSTLAGLAGSFGNADGTGSAARFYYPNGLAVDGSGNVFVADYYNGRIRKITAAGVVTTIGGGTAGGYSDGFGSAAGFNAPAGIAVGIAGQLFVADYGNNRITQGVDVTQPPILTAPTSSAITATPVSVAFTLPEAALPASVTISFGPNTLTLASSQGSAGEHSFSFNPANPTASTAVASGGIIPDGVYIVTLSYRDAAGSPAATASATDVRIDTLPPALTLPGDLTIEATGADGAVVTYAASADDPGGSGVSTSSFLPANGGTFPLGITTVNASATDNAGNITTGSFKVTVQDTTGPAVTVPENITLEATSATGAVATFSVSALDAVDGIVPATPDHASGNIFPFGTTLVQVTAADSTNHISNASFTVTVRDTTPPMITLPANITLALASAGGTAATFSVSANDTVDGPVTATPDHASGSIFPLGTTTVNASATDNAGNTATGSFTVTVAGVPGPEIAVKVNGAAIGDGGSVSFGSASVGVATEPQTFTIENLGDTPLSGLAVTKTGAAQTLFTITGTPAATLATGGSTTFTVQATPAAIGLKTAALHIASNDQDENPYDLNLTVTGIAAVPPVVTTLAAAGITVTGATVTGTVDAKGSDREVFFDYGIIPGYGNTVSASPAVVSGNGPVSVSTTLDTLQPHTKYYFRVRSSGTMGAASGASLTFTTLNRPPAPMPDTVIALRSTPIGIQLLENDSDPDGDALSVFSFTQPDPSAGVVIRSGANIIFIPTATFAGGSFTYIASDKLGMKSAPVMVSLVLGECALSSSSAAVSAAANTLPITVTSNAIWTASKSLSWVTVSPAAGIGNGTMTLSVQANATKTSRRGVITIGGTTFTLVQSGTLGFTIEAPAAVPPGMVAADYSLTVPALLPSVHFTATGLPSGLAINAESGEISGRPKAAGTFAVSVKGAAPTGAATTLPLVISIQPLPAGAVGIFQGPIARDETLTSGLGGRFELTTTAAGSLSGKITLGGASYIFPPNMVVRATVGDASPAASISIPRKASESALTVSFTIDSASHALTGGDISDGTHHTSFTAWRKKWGTAMTPLEKDELNRYLGLHTFALKTPENQSAVPQGSGYGSFTVAANTGLLTAAGKLADGTGFTCATFAGPNGEVLVYQALYGNKGSILGTLDITPGTPAFTPPYGDNTLAGSLSWQRPAIAGRLYAAGFGPYDLSAVGGRYVAPKAPKLVLGIVDDFVHNAAALAFSGADIINVAPDIAFRIKAGNVMVPLPAADNPRKTSLSITAGTGFFTGAFSLSDPNAFVGIALRPATYYGQIVRDSDGVPRGHGFYLLADSPASAGKTVNTTDQKSGRVTLQKIP